MKPLLVVLTVALGCSAAGPDAIGPGPGEPGTQAPAEPVQPAEPGEPGEPAQPVAPAQPASASNLPTDMQVLLDEHNRRRKDHCAPAMSWSPKVARIAQAWADHLRDIGCKFEHSRGGTMGENLAAGSAGALTAKGVVDMWYREVMMYDWSHPKFSMETGHFSQVVWIGSDQLGCGVSQCNGTSIWVCNYAPPGNMQGAFEANVKLKGCGK